MMQSYQNHNHQLLGEYFYMDNYSSRRHGVQVGIRITEVSL